jgi:hypothetical protein
MLLESISLVSPLAWYGNFQMTSKMVPRSYANFSGRLFYPENDEIPMMIPLQVHHLTIVLRFSVDNSCKGSKIPIERSFGKFV